MSVSITCLCHDFYLFIYLFFNFIFKLYITVLVLPNIKMNPPQLYMCSPSRTPLPPPSPFHPSGSSQCTSPKHPVSCIEPGLATRFIHDILHVSIPFSQIFPPSPSLSESCILLLPPSHFSRVRLCATPWTAAYQAFPSMGFSRQEHWSGLPFPSPKHASGK